MSDEIAARMRKEMQWMGTDDCLTSLTKADLRALLDERDRLIHDLPRLRAPVEGEVGEVVDRLIEWPGGDGDTMSGHHVGDLMETAADLIARQAARITEVEAKYTLSCQIGARIEEERDAAEASLREAREVMQDLLRRGRRKGVCQAARAWLAKHQGAPDVAP